MMKYDTRNAIDNPETMLLSIRDTARALACCEKTVWALTRAGRLPVVHITSRAIRYDRRDVKRFIEAAKGDRR